MIAQQPAFTDSEINTLSSVTWSYGHTVELGCERDASEKYRFSHLYRLWKHLCSKMLHINCPVWKINYGLKFCQGEILLVVNRLGLNAYSNGIMP